MSLLCLECGKGGSFDTLIIFDPHGVFDEQRTVSSFPNFYTCCGDPGNFEEPTSSRFAIVTQQGRENCFITGDDGPTLAALRYKRIHENDVKRQLPKIHGGLLAHSQKT